MATVSEIFSRASKVTGMRADSAESDIAFSSLNNMYSRACLECELTVIDASYTMTASAETVPLSLVTTASVMRLTHLRIESSGSKPSVQQVSRQEIQDNRSIDDINGLPVMYSVAYVNNALSIDFYPPINSGDQIKMSGISLPVQMTSTANIPASIPVAFHHDILTAEVISSLYERDNNIEAASIWHARALEGLDRLKEYLGQLGGTANRAYISPWNRGVRYEDQRRR